MLEPDQVIAIERTRRAFLKEIEPFIKLKTDIYKFALPKITLHPDGRVECHEQFTERQREILVMADELIDHIMAQYDGRAIRCPICWMVSYHPEDVSHRYCGLCHRFHDDIATRETK